MKYIFINILLEELENVVYDIYYVFDCLQTAPNGNIGGIIEDEFIVGRSRCGGWTRGC